MLPRDHQQMHRAGRLQQRPVIPAQARPVTQDQRCQPGAPALGINP